MGGIANRLRRQVERNTEVKPESGGIDYSAFEPGFKKRLRGFNKDMGKALKIAHRGNTPEKKFRMQIFLLQKWEKNMIHKIRGWDRKDQEAEVSEFQRGCWLSGNFNQLCTFLDLTKDDIDVLCTRMLKAV